MGFCSCTTKLFLFLFNLACSLLGIVIVVIGVIANKSGGSFKTFLEGEVSTTSIVLIVVGCVVFLISFFGCCGVIREDNCMITTYAVLLSAILLVQVAVGIMAFVYQKRIVKELDNYLSPKFANYEENKEAIDELQRTIQCCGLHGPSEYSVLPQSCCPGTKHNKGTCSINDAFQEPCLNKVQNLIQSQLKTIGLVALIIAVVEFFCIVCAFCMAHSMRRSYYA